ncbi:hypothetical protein [Serratia sp. UGAL515B_01]|uniref:hypothetical protein n=1 Tax=Serratia sp. UGAL515B_01 TaxID=2986763 RepID=UPI0029553CFB|nr:hypothetical protein [Serratia sp. UGAL515B_01]WON77472.1 hypothetical protein OK023_01815 [Serratia sp. UGAL515B_01]
MNNSRVFNEILATCTLIIMRGIVPSLTEFQGQLKDRIEQLCLDLEEEKHSLQKIDALRRLTCLVLDAHARKNFGAQSISWHGYELEHAFYGYNNGTLFTEQHAIALFNNDDEVITHYALQLATLSPVPLPGSQLRQSLAFQLPNVKPVPTIVPPKLEPIVTPETRPARRDFWPSLLTQLFVVAILLTVLWSVCRYFLLDGM